MKINTTRVLLAALLMATGLVMADDGDDGPHRGMHEKHEMGGMHGPRDSMGMGGMPDPARMVRHISRTLELDEAQTRELAEVVRAAKPHLVALRENAQANRAAIAALDTDASDYGDKIKDLAVKNGELATEGTLLMSQLRVDIHAKLTPEQRQELAERVDSMRQRREGRREGRRERHHDAHDDEVEM